MKTTGSSRALVILSALSLLLIYFLPVWNIQLWAPQYPEGIEMFIWIDHLSGDVEIINGLNHYIGMKFINEDMFPELAILPYALALLIAFGLLVGINGSKWLINLWAIVLVLGSLGLLFDMYLWGYDYGHNLDPTAAIQVPGMSYQPPLIGYKKLLNFGAYSVPDTGGWVFTSALVVAIVVWGRETFRKRKND